LKLDAQSDQSIFVRAAISGVIREGIIAAALTGLLILLFLGSWRSTLIITISIPLSILASVACLSALGETINIMTLGGLALAVGILVDDATVTIENINYHLEHGMEVKDAILEGARQIALPALVSTLSICIVLGLVAAIVLVYMLIVVNFQSLLDPFIIITALPAALAGIVWMLFLTHTTVSVPALTGAIMCMGVATANSVLVVSFARERMNAGDNAFEAALEAGFTRLRPVLMTALAMIIGMIPMALGLGDGGEQNAPLGRAVIGGLIFATGATLFFVPTVFSIMHGRPSSHPIHSAEIPNV
jgi:multidrug efflux pump subunit AcrB